MRKFLLPLIAAIALLSLPGCNGNGDNIIVPSDPSGGNDAGFSNASLSGTYVFSVHGSNFGNLARFVVTGNFIADGNGNITAGVRDSVDDAGRRTLNEAISGTYFVNADGRGQAIINGSSGQAIYRFVLESPASAKLFQIGTTSNTVRIDAVGTVQRQSGAPDTPTGAYIVRLDGEDNFLNPYGAVGRIVFTGNDIEGILDENDNGTFSPNLVASGEISLSAGRGTASLTVDGFLHEFVVYFVSPTKLELLSTDTDFLLQGNAEAQSSFAASAVAFAAAAPEQVFALAGFDSFGPRVEVGRMTLASTGFLLNAIEDIQINRNPSYFAAVNLSPVPGVSNYSVGGNGRWTANLNNIVNAPSADLVGWQISPQRSVVLSTNNDIVATGTMRAQTLGLTTASVSGHFAEALSGFETFFGNLELTANLFLNGLGAMNGTFDAQDDSFGLNLDVATTGSYTIDSAFGRSTNGNINSSNATTVIPSSGLPVVYYAVDADTIYFLPSRVGSIYLGTLIAQTP